MSYFAAAVLEKPDGWMSSEIDLAGIADIEEVADRLRDLDATATNVIMFVESDDSYLAIVRLDESDELRVFGSDAAFAEESRLGALLLGDVEEPVLEIEDIEDIEDIEAEAEGDSEPPVLADVDPVGDADLLADLGVPAHKLLQLCAHDGMMPSDITAEVCALLGCADEMEELREV